MTSEGKNIVELMEQVKKLYASTGLLLSTADGYMKEGGWKLRTNTNQCVTISYTPADAAYWFPWYAYRVYRNNRCPHVLSFVSVIFDDREDGRLLAEPLVSAGWHEYRNGTEITAEMAQEESAYDFVTWHIYLPGRRDDGQLVPVDWRQREEAEKYEIQRSATLAVPLVNIMKADDLKKRVIDPILGGLKQYTG